MKVEYSSNNSGGDWWLTDMNWVDLEEAGWDVGWFAHETGWNGKPYKDGRWLGALAKGASREGVSLRVAIAEWEDVTGQAASSLGCSCCGTPHSFTLVDDDGKWIDSYSPSFPEYGDDY